MFYDYDFLFTASLIIILLLFFYFSQYHLPVKRNRYFLSLLIMEVVVMALDTIATYMDDFHNMFSIRVLYIFNLFYFLCFITRAYQFYKYATSFFPYDKKREIMMRGTLGVGYLFLMISLMTHQVFSVTEDGYQAGPLYNVLYVFNALYFIMPIFLSLYYKISVREKKTLIAANSILIGGSLIRFFSPKVPIMDFFCTLALIIIYLGIQNPDLVVEEKTGLFNTAGFRYYAHEQFMANRRISLALISINNYNGLKSIYGRKKIHRCVKMIGQEMMTHFHHYVLSYQGVGQFLIATTDHLDDRDVTAIVQERFTQPFTFDYGEDLYLSYTMCYLDRQIDIANERDMMTLMQYVNAQAQFLGNGQVHYITNEDVQKYQHLLDVEDAVNHAVNFNQIEVYYQPIYHIQNHKIAGAEALARLFDTHLGFVSPEEFITAAERMGVIQKLGCQVIEKVCQFISSHDLVSLGLHYINVNVSPLQCLDERFPQVFSEILEHYHVDRSWIHLEITESTSVDMTVLNQMMNEMVNEGSAFNLDDYGTGYSNIHRISQYPFSTIKIDLTLTWSYFKGENKFLPHIMNMINEMGKSVTVEGVETKDMAQALSKMKADDLQGYYFSKPVPEEAFLDYLKNQA